ncbi:MAG TPA: P-type conjugative transfer protein TrbG [Candidatus Tumulicola sp.]|jgi:type IV secretion system protein VirB9
MLRQISLLAVFCAALCPAVSVAGSVSGPDGVLRYPFGQHTPPTLRCKPLFVCDLVLEPGESIVNVAVGDSVRWLIAPASSGSTDDATPHVLVKPTEAGLRTNLIVTTSRRTYYLALVSSYANPMLRIGFLYPQDPQQAFATATAGRNAHAEAVAPMTAIDRLDFNYRISGDRGLQPTRAFNDGVHTYLQMPPELREAPILFAVGSDGSDTLVNYRFTGQYYVVDGTPADIALVEGSGKHQRRALVARGN